MGMLLNKKKKKQRAKKAAEKEAPKSKETKTSESNPVVVANDVSLPPHEVEGTEEDLNLQPQTAEELEEIETEEEPKKKKKK